MPNRILKESICVSDGIDSLSWFEEVLFYRLIVNCDDFGRFDGRAAVIKNRLFPLKDDLTLGTVKQAIQKLATAGLVIPYESSGKPYLYLPGWTAHQTVRAKRSKYPAPECGQQAAEPGVKSSESICNHPHADAPVSECVFENPIRESESECESEKAPRRGAAPARPNGNGSTKKACGRYRLVMLSDAEYNELRAELGSAELERVIAYVDEYAKINGKKYRDWAAILRRASRDRWGLDGPQAGKPPASVRPGQDFQPSPERIRQNSDWLEDFLTSQGELP